MSTNKRYCSVCDSIVYPVTLPRIITNSNSYSNLNRDLLKAVQKLKIKTSTKELGTQLFRGKY
jgi:hypothetical protein